VLHIKVLKAAVLTDNCTYWDGLQMKFPPSAEAEMLNSILLA